MTPGRMHAHGRLCVHPRSGYPVHLLFGVAGIVLARTTPRARNYLRYVGITYGALFLYGLLVPSMSAATFVPVSDAGDFLHLVLAPGMIALSLLLDCGRAERKIGSAAA